MGDCWKGWESGRRVPVGPHLTSLARAFDLDEGYIEATIREQRRRGT